MRRPVVSSLSSRRQRGFSLIELMVTLIVGMMVVGALLAGYFAISVSSRNTQAMSQVTEDASIALGMLRGQIAQAGYSRPVGSNGSRFQRAYAGAALAGCDSAFSDLSLAIAALTCVDTSGSTAFTDSIAVAYEADASNSVTSGGVPLDCLGNSLTVVAGANPYYLGYSRFYIATSKVSSRNALYCRGPGSASGQALVENIEDMQIQYGVSNNVNQAGVTAQVAYYAGAAAVNTAVAMGNVVSVRICVVVASTDEVMDDRTPYMNCQNARTTPNDRRMYRTFRSTVLLHNRLGSV